MVTIKNVRKLALSFENVEEYMHFDKPSFRVNKKIFATIDLKKGTVCLKLSEADQSLFSSHDATVIYPVPNAWGRQGWTYITLKKIRRDLFKELLTLAYCTRLPKKLAEKYRKTLE